MLEVLDTAGQEEYTALRDQWIRDGEGFVLVYSITSRSSFTRIQRFYNQIQRVKDSNNAGSPTGPSYLNPQLSTPAPTGPVPVMLVGNKSDKVTERAVSSQEGQALARELGCDFVEASAKNCINVERAFYDVVRALRRQKFQPLKQSDRKGTGFSASTLRDRNTDHFPHTGKKSQHKAKCVIL
jgi:GTPase KRas